MACLLVVMCMMRSMKTCWKVIWMFLRSLSLEETDFCVIVFWEIWLWNLKIDMNTVKTTYRMPYLDFKRVRYGLSNLVEKSVTKKGRGDLDSKLWWIIEHDIDLEKIWYLVGINLNELWTSPFWFEVKTTFVWILAHGWKTLRSVKICLTVCHVMSYVVIMMYDLWLD